MLLFRWRFYDIDNIPEKDTCVDLGIKMVFGVGGEKIQSSSWLIEGVKNNDEKEN